VKIQKGYYMFWMHDVVAIDQKTIAPFSCWECTEGSFTERLSIRVIGHRWLQLQFLLETKLTGFLRLGLIGFILG
jgi:hypothetical protein